MLRQLKDEIRKGLLEDYQHKQIENTVCCYCGKEKILFALHVLEFYHDQNITTPPHFIPMSASRGIIRGSIPICIDCAPRCSICSLPMLSWWGKKMAKTIINKYKHYNVKPGCGICQHIYVIKDLVSLFKKVELPGDNIKNAIEDNQTE